jgi:hypothetical protein
VARLCEFYPGICLTTEEKAWKNLSRGKKNLQVRKITTNVEECGPCPVFASFTLAFALQLRKKHGKTSVRVKKTSVRLRKTSVKVQYAYY